MSTQQTQTDKRRSRSGLVVNEAVVNVYRQPSFKSEVVTQALLGELPAVIDQDGKWFHIEQWDGYRGWIYHFYLVKNPDFPSDGEVERVNAPWLQIRAAPTDEAAALRTAVFGVELPVLSRRDDWTQISLPDGLSGWWRNPTVIWEDSQRQRMIQVGTLFIGSPYMWGGKSPQGFDCSGFVQTCFRAAGVDIPRDAHLQFKFADLPEIGIEKAQPGDLFFFSEDNQGITHVGMSLGGADFIHASGRVKMESLSTDSERYNHQLRVIFTAGRDVTGLLDEQ